MKSGGEWMNTDKKVAIWRKILAVPCALIGLLFFLSGVSNAEVRITSFYLGFLLIVAAIMLVKKVDTEAAAYQKWIQIPSWKRKIAVCCIILALFFCCFALDDSRFNAIFFVSGVLVIIAILLLRKVDLTKREQKRLQRQEAQEEKRRRVEEKQLFEQELKRQEAMAECTMSGIYHAFGLPLSKGQQCKFRYEEQEFAIEGGGHIFHLPLEQVRAVEIETDTQIQNHYVSDPGAAIAGNEVFGTTGALFLSSPRKITDKTVMHYLLITYDKDGMVAQLALLVTPSLKQAQKVVALYNANHRQAPEDIML